MLRYILVLALLLVPTQVKAQSWEPEVIFNFVLPLMKEVERYDQRRRYRRREYREERRQLRNYYEDYEYKSEIKKIQPPRPEYVAHDFPPHTILIHSRQKKLYYFIDRERAFVYPVGVGREGFQWQGVEKISKIVYDPDWIPPAEMRLRKPSLPIRVAGGDPRNPLGVVAMYLGNTLYRIHGTDAPQTVGTSNSSGCFRMYNEHALHLARLVEKGTVVYVRR